MDGITFLEAVKEHRPDVVRMLLTAHAGIDNAMAAINRSRVFGSVTKPWSPEVLKGTVASAFEHHNLTIENKRLQKLTHEQNDQLKLINWNLDSLVRKRTPNIKSVLHSARGQNNQPMTGGPYVVEVQTRASFCR
jgi:response regulator RpfG family c-di-GMP phosphodiesterase